MAFEIASIRVSFQAVAYSPVANTSMSIEPYPNIYYRTKTISVRYLQDVTYFFDVCMCDVCVCGFICLYVILTHEANRYNVMLMLAILCCVRQYAIQSTCIVIIRFEKRALNHHVHNSTAQYFESGNVKWARCHQF